jgi:hypothetical protein
MAACGRAARRRPRSFRPFMRGILAAQVLDQVLQWLSETDRRRLADDVVADQARDDAIIRCAPGAEQFVACLAGLPWAVFTSCAPPSGRGSCTAGSRHTGAKPPANRWAVPGRRRPVCPVPSVGDGLGSRLSKDRGWRAPWRWLVIGRESFPTTCVR